MKSSFTTNRAPLPLLRSGTQSEGRMYTLLMATCLLFGHLTACDEDQSGGTEDGVLDFRSAEALDPEEVDAPSAPQPTDPGDPSMSTDGGGSSAAYVCGTDAAAHNGVELQWKTIGKGHKHSLAQDGRTTLVVTNHTDQALSGHVSVGIGNGRDEHVTREYEVALKANGTSQVTVNLAELKKRVHGNRGHAKVRASLLLQSSENSSGDSKRAYNAFADTIHLQPKNGQIEALGQKNRSDELEAEPIDPNDPPEGVVHEDVVHQ